MAAAIASNSETNSFGSRYFVFKVKRQIGRRFARFQHVHNVSELQKADSNRRWRQFLKCADSYMLFQSVRNEASWLCCYKEDVNESLRSTLHSRFPEDEFKLVFRVKAENYTMETNEVYFMKKKKGEAKCFASVRKQIPTRDNHSCAKGDDGLACDICSFE